MREMMVSKLDVNGELGRGASNSQLRLVVV